MRLPDAVKAGLFRAGAFNAFHAWRNRETLTVMMFHRVLPEEEIVQCEADPLYTVTPALFADVISFLQRHYTCVSLNDVLASHDRMVKLPSHSALITFDDGWRDNLEYAVPLLRAVNVPSVLFVATDALEESACWWQETLLWALRSHRASFEDIWGLAGEGSAADATASSEPMHALILRYGALTRDQRNMLLRPLMLEFRRSMKSNQMLTAEDLRELHSSGVAIGAHGASHLPLTKVESVLGDVARARDWLTKNVDSSSATTLSFPHGCFDERVVEATRHAGYRLMFTSEEVLNPCPGGFLENDLVGRIEIGTGAVANSIGKVSEPHLARWLFLRGRPSLRFS